MAEALTDRLEALTHGSATQPVGTVEWCGAVCSAMEEAAQALRLLGEVEKALEDVVNPLGKLRRDAEARGHQLSGQAYFIANDRSFIQSIARSALDKLRKGMG